MTKSPNTRDDTPTPPKQSTAVLLVATMADTTWRMAVPAVGGTLLGVWCDSQFGTKPWFMFAGIALGCAGAVLLVMRQLRKVKQQ